MISKNILLTGEKNVGKSTILERIFLGLELLDEDIAGFKTLPLYENQKFYGFYMKALGRYYSEKSQQHVIGIYQGEDYVPKCLGVTQTFEELGVDILNYSLQSAHNIVLLDELGFLEQKAWQFQQKIHEVLDSPKWVLGVIKPKDIQFLNSIRSRKDITVLEVSMNNRDELPEKILHVISKGESK